MLFKLSYFLNFCHFSYLSIVVVSHLAQLPSHSLFIILFFHFNLTLFVSLASFIYFCINFLIFIVVLLSAVLCVHFFTLEQCES